MLFALCALSLEVYRYRIHRGLLGYPAVMPMDRNKAWDYPRYPAVEPDYKSWKWNFPAVHSIEGKRVLRPRGPIRGSIPTRRFSNDFGWEAGYDDGLFGKVHGQTQIGSGSYIRGDIGYHSKGGPSGDVGAHYKTKYGDFDVSVGANPSGMHGGIKYKYTF